MRDGAFTHSLDYFASFKLTPSFSCFRRCLSLEFAHLGILPSGVGLLVADADIVCAEGFIESLFFAGSSGSRKSILHRVSYRTTVLVNHCSEFINDPHSLTGVLEENPIHRDRLSLSILTSYHRCSCHTTPR